jgi:photosystem II stability/assembly factor-like uncharacterized protein
MANLVRIFALTGDAVATFRLDDCDPELGLEGWQPRCIAVDRRNPRRVYVGTMDSGLWFSDDGGAGWRLAGPSIDEPRVLSVAVSQSDERSGVSIVYPGTEPSNLYRSEDGGLSWQLLPGLRELPSASSWSVPPRPWTHHVRTIALDPNDPEWLAVGIELGGVMRSRDGGKTWIDHNAQAHSDAHQLLTHPLAPERLYEAAGQGIARSDDRGDTWMRKDEGLDRHYAWAQAVDPADPDLWYVAVSRSPAAAHGDGDGQARWLRSRGNGWEAVNGWGDSAELRRMPYALVTLSDQPGRLLAGLRGGTLLITDDAGQTWSRLSLRLPDVIDLATASA